MQAGLRYDAERVRVELRGSRNLRQRGDRIHRNAAARLRALDLRVRRALDELAAAAAAGPRPDQPLR